MFVITLRYVAGLDQIDDNLQAHTEWVDGQYDDGVFVASGAMTPREGGVILATGLARAELEARLALDPFRQKGLAEYQIVEFTPRRVAAGLERLQG
ncbi:GTP cyclohydrolase [Dactylosporangium vinaceum]|uniref:YciI family protein n=1 Tax=Dactylosporangium vinaceum TaxID=53362 RepID=A0ABV5MFA5_9ACTN|nr:YciI family protein [Dactylosporangium vinaceum]UAB98688.1 GTP cyclohydrolase [Dactylosporangium vinaceum]